MIIEQKQSYNQKTFNASINIVSAYDTHAQAPHRHIQSSAHPSFHCVLYTLEGSGLVVYNNGQTEVLEKGELFISKFNNIRMFECKNNIWHYHLIWFQPSNLCLPLNQKISVELNDAQEFISEIIELLDKKNNFNTFRANCKLANRIADYLVLFNKENENIFSSKEDEIINYINENIEKNLKLKEIASRFHYCEKQLRNIILKKTGMLPKKYILTTKLTQACKMIDSSSYTIEYISFALNFSSVAHFVNLFKATYKVTPKEYRQHSKLVT